MNMKNLLCLKSKLSVFDQNRNPTAQTCRLLRLLGWTNFVLSVINQFLMKMKFRHKSNTNFLRNGNRNFLQKLRTFETLWLNSEMDERMKILQDYWVEESKMRVQKRWQNFKKCFHILWSLDRLYFLLIKLGNFGKYSQEKIWM